MSCDARVWLEKTSFPSAEMNCQRGKEEKGVHSESLNIFGARIRFFIVLSSTVRRRDVSAIVPFSSTFISFHLSSIREPGLLCLVNLPSHNGDVYVFPFWKHDFSTNDF